MMELYVVRALDVVRLTLDQLQRLQALEEQKGYVIPSWNLRNIFSLPSLKDFYKIPDKPESLEKYKEKIKLMLKEKNLLLVEGDDSVFTNAITAMHSFDWGIWHKKHELEFHYGTLTKDRNLNDSVDEAEKKLTVIKPDLWSPD